MSDTKLIQGITRLVKRVTKEKPYRTNRFGNLDKKRDSHAELVREMTKLRKMAGEKPELAVQHDEFVDEINNFYDKNYRKPEESQSGKMRDGRTYLPNLQKSNTKTPHTLDEIEVNDDGFEILNSLEIKPEGGGLRGARKEEFIKKGEEDDDEDEKEDEKPTEVEVDVSGDVIPPPTKSPDEIAEESLSVTPRTEVGGSTPRSMPGTPRTEVGGSTPRTEVGGSTPRTEVGGSTPRVEEDETIRVEVEDDEEDDEPDMPQMPEPMALEPELEADPVPQPINTLNAIMLESGDPKDRRKADFKTKEELIKDIKFYFKKYGNLLGDEKKRYAKMAKTLKNLKDLHKRITGKLFADEPEKTIGIIINADEYISRKLNELLVQKSVEGITPEDMTINVEAEKPPSSKQYGSYLVGVNKSGLLASGNVPIYRSLPSNPEKIPSTKQMAKSRPVKLKKLPSQRFDQTNAAKKYVRFNLLEAPENPDSTRLNIII